MSSTLHPLTLSPSINRTITKPWIAPTMAPAMASTRRTEATMAQAGPSKGTKFMPAKMATMPPAQASALAGIHQAALFTQRRSTHHWGVARIGERLRLTAKV